MPVELLEAAEVARGPEDRTLSVSIAAGSGMVDPDYFD
jgi:hypothetical protein